MRELSTTGLLAALGGAVAALILVSAVTALLARQLYCCERALAQRTDDLKAAQLRVAYLEDRQQPGPAADVVFIDDRLDERPGRETWPA